MTDYLKNFELLLSLLMHSIQEVQEREIVYHGYLRWAWSLKVLSPAHPHENVCSDPLTGFQWEDLNIRPSIIKAFL